MEVYYIGSVPYSPDSLYHHGILGQKWGKRNGPPYPLSAGDHSEREKKAGYQKSIGGGRNKEDYKTDFPSDHKSGNKSPSSDTEKGSKKFVNENIRAFVQSKGFKTALVVTATAVTVYAAYRIGKHYLANQPISNSGFKPAPDRHLPAMALFRQEFNALPKNFNSLADIPKATKDYHGDYFNSAAADAFKSLTEGINHGVDENNLISSFGRNMNCTFCSSAIIMRLKGYEVTAAEFPTFLGVPREINRTWFKGAFFTTPQFKNSNDLYDHLLKQGDGSYGSMNLFFNNGAGHSIVYLVKNGAVEIIDGQTNKTYGSGINALDKNLFSMFGGTQFLKTEICNLTNCDPTEEILRCLL